MDDNNYIAHFETYLLTEKRVSQNTFSAYKSDISQLLKFLQNKEITISSCKTKNLKEYLRKLHDQKLKSKSLIL